MSSSTKRKHVFQEARDVDISLPTPNQQIVRITSSKGNNLHEVLAPNGSKFLVTMPVKFRRNVWVRRGSYLLVEAIEEGDKVKAEIIRILTNGNIAYFKEEKVWPQEFNDKEEDKLNEDDLFTNTNRREISDTDESDDSDSEK